MESFQSGLFRVDLPRFPELAWREALTDALAHRDYGGFGSIAIRIHEDRLVVGSPGGCFGGVSEANLLTTESRRRNELLAQTLQPTGLAERSAVGIRRMYRAMLLGGKPPSAYRSAEGSVTVLHVLDERKLGPLRGLPVALPFVLALCRPEHSPWADVMDGLGVARGRVPSPRTLPLSRPRREAPGPEPRRPHELRPLGLRYSVLRELGRQTHEQLIRQRRPSPRECVADRLAEPPTLP